MSDTTNITIEHSPDLEERKHGVSKDQKETMMADTALRTSYGYVLGCEGGARRALKELERAMQENDVTIVFTSNTCIIGVGRQRQHLSGHAVNLPRENVTQGGKFEQATDYDFFFGLSTSDRTNDQARRLHKRVVDRWVELLKGGKVTPQVIGQK